MDFRTVFARLRGAGDDRRPPTADGLDGDAIDRPLCWMSTPPVLHRGGRRSAVGRLPRRWRWGRGGQ